MAQTGDVLSTVSGLLAMLFMWALPMGLIIIPVVLVVRALNRIATAHESAARTLEQIAGYLARKA